MKRTGILRFTGNKAFVGRTLLARSAAKDPLGGATRYLKARGFTHGRGVTVSGEPTHVPGAPGVAVLDLADVVSVIQIDQEGRIVSKTGTLRITGNESRVAGTLLARCGTESPRSNATKFVQARGFDDGDKVTAFGEMGTIGEPPGVPVLCITDVSSAGGGM
jgi:hypothetical protein